MIEKYPSIVLQIKESPSAFYLSMFVDRSFVGRGIKT
jgi:hypothetical protein